MAFIVPLIWALVLVLMVALYIRVLIFRINHIESRKLSKFRLVLLALLLTVLFVFNRAWKNWVGVEVEPWWYYAITIALGLSVMTIYIVIHLIFPAYIRMEINQISVDPSDEKEDDDRPSGEEFAASS